MDNKLVTMLVNGVEWTAEENTPNAEYYYTEKLQKNPANCGGPDLKPYRTALYIDKDGINNDLSVPQAVQGGSFDEKSANSVTVVSHSDDFSALMLVGTDYTITDSSFRFITEGRERT